VVEGDDLLDRRLDLRGAGDQRAGGGVVDAQQLALGGGALGAGLVLGGDPVQRIGPEGQRHDQLADVVQQPAEVRDVGVGAGALGDALRGAGDGGGVQV
jgi:hypothetical protein